jgi:hypothetical protein
MFYHDASLLIYTLEYRIIYNLEIIREKATAMSFSTVSVYYSIAPPKMARRPILHATAYCNMLYEWDRQKVLYETQWQTNECWINLCNLLLPLQASRGVN